MTSAPAEVRRRRRHREARRTILAAAESLLQDEGVGGFTMRRLAARSGYTVPSTRKALHAGDRLLGRPFEHVQQALWAL